MPDDYDSLAVPHKERLNFPSRSSPGPSHFERSTQQTPKDQQGVDTSFYKTREDGLPWINPQRFDQRFGEEYFQRDSGGKVWSGVALEGWDQDFMAFNTWDSDPVSISYGEPQPPAFGPPYLREQKALPPCSDWSPNFSTDEEKLADRLDLFYDFVVDKGGSFWKLKPGYVVSANYPDLIECGPTRDQYPYNPGPAKVYPYQCHFSGCKAKPFQIHYDLHRHFHSVHYNPERVGITSRFPQHQTSPSYSMAPPAHKALKTKNQSQPEPIAAVATSAKEVNTEPIGSTKNQRQPNQRLYQRPKHERILCAWCDECPEGYRGSNDLQRHIDRCHKVVVSKWVCTEPLDGIIHEDTKPIISLAKCKACSNQKQYGAYYNAAAHLRRTHFNPKPRIRRAYEVENRPQNRVGHGQWLPMSELKRWMQEIRVPVIKYENEISSSDRDYLLDTVEETSQINSRAFPSVTLPLPQVNGVGVNPVNLNVGSVFDIEGLNQPIETKDAFQDNRLDSFLYDSDKETSTFSTANSFPSFIPKNYSNSLSRHISTINDELATFDEAFNESDSDMGRDFKLSDSIGNNTLSSFGRDASQFRGAPSIASDILQPNTHNSFSKDVEQFLISPTLENDASLHQLRDLPIGSQDCERSSFGHDVKTILGVATDSGYASLGIGRDLDEADIGDDDNASVFTDNQDFEVADNVKEKLVSAFSSEIFQHLESLLANVNRNKSVRRQLAGLLKDFSIRLCNTASLGQQKDATVFIRHYRNRIANSLEASIKQFSLSNDLASEDNVEGEEEGGEEEEENPFKAEKGLTLEEKLEKLLWSAPNPSHVGDEGLNYPDAEEEDDKDREDYAITHFSDAWTFLTDSHAYKWLLGKLSVVLLTNSEDSLSEKITKDITRGLNTKSGFRKYNDVCEAQFHILDWPLSSFLNEQFSSEEHIQLGSVITITGSGVDAQALACADYMRQVWPTTGFETLRALQQAVDTVVGNSCKYVMSDNTQIKITVLDTEVYVSVKGTEPSVAEIGQQLAWLGAALRVAPDPNHVGYCTPKVTALMDKRSIFAISFHLKNNQHGCADTNLNGACWQNLFRNPMAVEGYPILARLHEEKGLEIPLNMMARLGYASRVTNFDGGLLVKGFSTLFAPMKRVKDSIQWHYFFERNGSRISYLAADDQCSDRARIDKVHSSCLQVSRHFLGWTSSVEICTGTKNAKYEDIDWPGANLARAGIAFEKASIVLGNYITGGASFIRGNKDTPIYLRRGGPYEQEIHFASRMKVVLYDVGDRRGWLVDGASALLHLTRTQLAWSPYCDSNLFNVEDFQHADSAGGVCAAKKALLNPKNRELSIFEEVEVIVESKTAGGELRKTTKRWTYQDLVRQTYHILEQIHDYETKMLTSAATAVHLTDREKLMGFAFMDIVDGQNDLRPRISVLKSSGRGWVDFIRSIRAITLLGRGFGEIFRPSKDSNNLCKRWKTIPTGMDYLVVCNSMLKDICKRHGSHDSNPMELAHEIYWHKPDKLFEPCDFNHMISSGCCDRVQVLLPPSLGSKRHPQPFGHQNGAVIFGRSRRFPWRWPSKGDPVQDQSDSEADDSSDFTDSGLGSSHPSQSDSSNSGHVGSATLISSKHAPSLHFPEVIMSGTLENESNSTTQQTLSPLASAGIQNFDPSHNSFNNQSIGINHSEVPQWTNTAYSQGTHLDPSTQIYKPQQLNSPKSSGEMRETGPNQGKRTWDKMKEMTPRFLPGKRQKGA